MITTKVRAVSTSTGKRKKCYQEGLHKGFKLLEKTFFLIRESCFHAAPILKVSAGRVSHAYKRTAHTQWLPKKFCPREGPDSKHQPHPPLWALKTLSVFEGIRLLIIGHTWDSTFHDRPLKDLLGELRLIVILICHRDHYLHRVFDWDPV